MADSTGGDDLDEFTKNILNRARQREELLSREELADDGSCTKENLKFNNLEVGLSSRQQELKLSDNDAEISASPVSRKNRLAALAQTINAWEDDLGVTMPTTENKINIVAMERKIQSPKQLQFVVPLPGRQQQQVVVGKATAEKLPQKPVVKESLSKPVVVKEILSEKPVVKEVLPMKQTESTQLPRRPFAGRQSPLPWNQNSPKVGAKDPSELSVLERARLFERGAGAAARAPAPAAAPAPAPAPAPVAACPGDPPARTYFGGAVFKEPEPVVNILNISLETKIRPDPLETSMETDTTAAKRCHDDMSKSDTASPSKLLAESIATSVKRIKVVGNQGDSMYPSLSDIETGSEQTTTDEEESFNSTVSTSSVSFVNKLDYTTELTTSVACRAIDDLIDEALEGQTLPEDDTFFASSPLSSSSPIHKKLTHTVSLYRKQQQTAISQNKDSELESIPGSPEGSSPEESGESDLKERIEAVERQVVIQQNAIAQASKLLNVCETSFEFINSTEYIEGERVLLIASQRRSQLLSYLGKLRSSSSEKPGFSVSKVNLSPRTTRCNLKIGNLELYGLRQKSSSDYVYHVIILLKNEENVFHSNVVAFNCGNGELKFGSEFEFCLLPDFEIKLEVYVLRAFKRVDIDHNVKYHIQGPHTPGGGSTEKSKFSFLTPQKSVKATDLTSTPNSSKRLRSSNFQLHGNLTIDLGNLHRNEKSLVLLQNQLLLPNISMDIAIATKNEIRCEGFLTVFNDVAGLGHWLRKYAVLNEDYQLEFWTYPEDRGVKPPVMAIDLTACITPRVCPAPRETCARPNTFLLVTTRDPRPDDKDTLVVSLHGNYAAVKHLVSADDRQERDKWVANLNTALTNMRAWRRTPRAP